MFEWDLFFIDSVVKKKFFKSTKYTVDDDK